MKNHSIEEKEDLMWLGQKTSFTTSLASDSISHLPTFTRKPLTYNNALNEYRDLIIRNPFLDDDRDVPLAVVSKKYALIQHTDAVLSILDSLESVGQNPSELQASILLSDYGERLRIAFDITEYGIDPGDGHVIFPKIVLWNSVDKSRSFELSIQWFRLICGNGLGVWELDDRLRRIHNVDFSSTESISQFLIDRLPKSKASMLKLSDWLHLRVDISTILHWVEKEVLPAWKMKNATRVIRIIQTGRDGSVGRIQNNIPPWQQIYEPEACVPGLPSYIDNVYHILQVLLWVANTESNLEAQEKKMVESHNLIRALVKSIIKVS